MSMNHDEWIELECRRVLEKCEHLANTWGLSVAIRSFEELGIPGDRGAAGFFIERPLPQWDVHNAVVAVDLKAAIQLSDPVCRLSSWISHELAHASVSALEHCTIPCEPHDASAIAAGIANPAVPVELLRRELPPWTGHEHVFIRLLCITVFRLRAAGISVSDVWAFPSGDYMLSPLAWYRDALGPEPERMQDADIVEAMTTKAPAAFLRLWREDVARAAAEKKTLGSS